MKLPCGEDQYGGGSELKGGGRIRESSSVAIDPGQGRLTESPPQDWRVGMENAEQLSSLF